MKSKLNDKMVAMVVNAKCLLMREEGQDLIEYALLVAMISLGAVAAMTTLAGSISAAFTAVSTKLTTNT